MSDGGVLAAPETFTIYARILEHFPGGIFGIGKEDVYYTKNVSLSIPANTT